MKPLAITPSLTEQAYQAILEEICDGSLVAGSHLIQEQLAKTLGVSRQPIQQAMALLKADGLVEDAPGRGLRVKALDLPLMRQHYEIRAVLDGLATKQAAVRCAGSAEMAAELKARGDAIIAEGLRAVETGSFKLMVNQDGDFHALIYAYSGNPLIANTAEPHWRHLKRVMSEVLRVAETPQEIWRQHGDILEAIVNGQAEEAERLAVNHIERAAAGLAEAFRSHEANPSQFPLNP